jgi:mersacidin/lichenicidin family type 2 lantibiotic
MSIGTIIRAWKDEDFRATLNEAQRKLLPESPAGDIQLSDADLRGVVGGAVSAGFAADRTDAGCPKGRV